MHVYVGRRVAWLFSGNARRAARVVEDDRLGAQPAMRAAHDAIGRRPQCG